MSKKRMLFPLVMILILHILLIPAKADPVFSLAQAQLIGCSEIRLKADRDFCKLQINLFSEGESLVQQAQEENGCILIILKRPLLPEDVFSLYADGEDETGEVFSLHRTYSASFLGLAAWRLEVFEQEMEQFGWFEGNMPLHIPRKLASTDEMRLLWTCAPKLTKEVDDQQTLYSTGEDCSEWMCLLFSETPVSLFRDGNGQYVSAGNGTETKKRLKYILLSGELSLPRRTNIQLFYEPEELALDRICLGTGWNRMGIPSVNITIHQTEDTDTPYGFIVLTESFLPAELFYDNTGTLRKMIWRGEEIQIYPETEIEGVELV